MKIIILIGMLLAIFPAKAQENRDLYYAQPKNTGLYLGFIYVSSKNFLLVGEQKIFLFGEQKTIIDTLSLTQKLNTFLDNVNHVTLISSNRISVSTLQRVLLIDIVNDKLKVVEEFSVKDLVKKIGKYDLFVLFDKGVIARSNNKSRSHFYFEQQEDNNFNIRPSMNLTPVLPIVTQYRGSEVLGFTKYQKLGDDVFLFRRKQNALSKYNILSKENEEIKLPSLEGENQLHEFFVDPIGKQCYLFVLSKSGANKIFSLSMQNRTFELKTTTNHIVRGVFDGKMYVSGIFDNALAHYLIPLSGQNQEVNFIDK